MSTTAAGGEAAPLSHRLAYHALIMSSRVTSPAFASTAWERCWARAASRFRGRTTVNMHGRRAVVNTGYAYPAFSRRWPTYNNPLVEVVHQTALHRGTKITVIDVGAAVGDTVLLLMDKCAGDVSRFLCFEPDAEFFGYLDQNIGSESGVHLFPDMLADSDDSQPELVRIHSGTASAQGSTRRSARTLDSILRSEGRIDVLKIDTDGFDGRVLGGAKGLLRRDHPSVIFEWHPLLIEATGQDWRHPFDVLLSTGYTWFVWFTKEGDFSHLTQGFDEASLMALRQVCLDEGGPRPDWHFDVVALTDEDAPNPTHVAALRHSRRAG